MKPHGTQIPTARRTVHGKGTDAGSRLERSSVAGQLLAPASCSASEPFLICPVSSVPEARAR